MPTWRGARSPSRMRSRHEPPEFTKQQRLASGVINSRARPCDEGAIRSTRSTTTCRESQKIWVLVVTILASTMAYVDESVVNIALPAIEADLGTSVVVIQWLVNAYTLSLAALLLIGGAAGDRFGRRLVFAIGTAIFAVAS